MKMDDRQAFQIHGIISSDSDSDYNSRDFDEEYYALKPPPLDYQSIKDKIVVISREQGTITNIWDDRLKNLGKDDAKAIFGAASGVRILTKKKKKKKSKTGTGNNVENGGAVQVNCKKTEVQLPVLTKEIKKKKTRCKPGQSMIKGISPEVVYDPQKLKSVWHSDSYSSIFQQELSLQRQKESNLNESWIKTTGINIKPKETKKKQQEAVVSGNKTETKSKQPVKKKISTYELCMRLAGIKIESKKTKEQENAVNNVKKSKQTVVQPPSVNLAKVSKDESAGIKIKSKKTKKVQEKAVKKISKQPTVKSPSINLAQKGKNSPKKKAKKIVANFNNSESIATSPIDFWWNYDNHINNQSLLLPSFTNDIKNDTKFNKVKGTETATKKPVKKAEVKKTWAELFKISHDNMTEQKSQVDMNIEEARKSFCDEEKWNIRVFGTEILKNEIPERDEAQIVQNVSNSGFQNSNLGLFDKETVQSVWYYNNFNFNDTQYLTNFANDTEKDSRANIDIEETNLAVKTKKRKRSKKKSKQSVDISMNQSLSQNSDVNLEKDNTSIYVKEAWDMSYEEEKSNFHLFDRETVKNDVPEKECTQIVENSNFVLLDKDVLRNKWRFDNFVDETISCFAYLPNYTENDASFNIVTETANLPTKTKKRRSKNKSKKSIDSLTNQNHTHSKETLDEGLTPQLLDEHLPNSIDTRTQEIRNEDLNLIDTNQVDVSTAAKPKKKKKPKQLNTQAPPNEVSHDTEETNEGTVEFGRIIRENWDFNSENLRNSMNSNKEMTSDDTANKRQPQQVFGDDFKDFIHNICCDDPTVISNLSAFNYEQLERSYLAYREKNCKDANQVDVSAVPKPKKKKLKQLTVEPPLGKVGQDTERTNEDTAYRESNTVLGISNSMVKTVKESQRTKKGENKAILTDGDRLLNSLTGLTNSLTVNDRHSDNLTDGDRLLGSLTTGDRLLKNLTDSDRHSNNLTEDDRLLCGLKETNKKTYINFKVTDKIPKNFTSLTQVSQFYPEGDAKTSESLGESSHIKENQSTNDSKTVLEAKLTTGKHSNDFEESFGVFTRTFNDAVGYDLISWHNADYYKQLYRVLHNKTKKINSSTTKKAIDDEPIAKEAVRDNDRLSHYLTGSNDDSKSKPQVTSTYTTSIADSWYPHSDYQENFASDQKVARIAPFSRRNQDSYGHSSRYQGSYKGERDFDEDFRTESHTVKYNHLGDLPNDRYRLYSDKTGKETLYSEDYSLTSVLLYVFVIVMLAVAVMNMITSILSFLYSNIFIVGLLFLVFMKFKK